MASNDAIRRYLAEISERFIIVERTRVAEGLYSEEWVLHYEGDSEVWFLTGEQLAEWEAKALVTRVK